MHRHRHGIYLEPSNSNREDNIWVFDVRAEKTVNVHRPRRASRLFLDVFNITNSHASETISRATGPGYQKPSAILAPVTRQARLPLLCGRWSRRAPSGKLDSCGGVSWVGGANAGAPRPFLLGLGSVGTDCRSQVTLAAR